MANNETILSTAQPCCYCCLSETNLTEHNNGKGLVYWLCSECESAGFKKIDGLAILVCPNHGIQYHKDIDIDSHQFVQRWASKKKYWYPIPVHTRHTKESGNKPMHGICTYEEMKP